MMELIAQNMAPIMFLSLIFFLIIGYPVAFALAANGFCSSSSVLNSRRFPKGQSTYLGRC